ncbi:hypothetical protein N9R81_05965 [Flavobacteriales bacterium]|nr:hypothetical protein [Flavobacteriales bacterium]
MLVLTIGLILFALFSHYTPVPLEEEISFSRNKSIINRVDFGSNRNTEKVKIGWGRANMVPTEQKLYKTSSFLKRQITTILDSTFVSCIYFVSKNEHCIMLSYDLLLVTPEIKKKVTEMLNNKGLTNIYFSASHTHSSFGGYGKGIISNLALGSYDEEIVSFITQKTEVAYKQASQNASRLNSVSYREKITDRCVNRLTDQEYVKQNIREVVFASDRGKSSVFSLNIHPTFVWSTRDVLSNDYPKIFTHEKDSSFGMFLAGTMGSIKPMSYQRDTTQVTRFKRSLDDVVPDILLDSLRNTGVYFTSIKLNVMPLNPLLTSNIQSSPWLSNLLIKQQDPSIEVVRVGEILFISLPCELSAEYYAGLKVLANEKGYKLFLTSFNGTYLGYATPSQNFEIDHMETRTMNWTGKYGGDYFNQLVIQIISNQPQL